MFHSKLSATIASTLLLIVVAWPVLENWHPQAKDDFPLSYYPMFSAKRDSTSRLRYFVGYDSTGRRHCISHNYIGKGGMNQVRRQINKYARQGSGQKLAKKVARRVAKSREWPFCQLTYLELVEGEYHVDNYFIRGDKTPLSETVICRQAIEKP